MKRTSEGITALEFKICCNQSHPFLLLTPYQLLGLADLLCKDIEVGTFVLHAYHCVGGGEQARGFEVWTDDCSM